MLKAIHAQEDRKRPRPRIRKWSHDCAAMKLQDRGRLVEQKVDETLTSTLPSKLATDSHQQSARADHPRDRDARAWSVHFPTAIRR